MKSLLLTISFFLFVIIFPLSAQASIVINEFLPDPESDNDEWVELYNTGTEPIDISNWSIKDDKNQLFILISQESTMSAKEFRSFSRSNYLLNNSGDTVFLFDQNNNQKDSQNYSSNPGDNISIGRYPDGSGSWEFLQNPTPGGTNSTGNPFSSLSPSSSPSSSPSPSSSSSESSPSLSPSPTVTTTVTTTTTTTTKKNPSAGGLKPSLEPAAFLQEKEEQELGEILGQEDLPEETPEATKSGFQFNKNALLSWILTGSGLLFLTAAGIPFARQYFFSGKTASKQGKIQKWQEQSFVGGQLSSGQE